MDMNKALAALGTTKAKKSVPTAAQNPKRKQINAVGKPKAETRIVKR